MLSPNVNKQNSFYAGFVSSYRKPPPLRYRCSTVPEAIWELVINKSGLLYTQYDREDKGSNLVQA